MTVLAIFGFVALLVLGVLGAIARAFAVDEARGYIQNRVRADVEGIIASLPPELREEWADEWREELAAVISMPLTAIRFARGLRQSAVLLVGQHEIVPATTGNGAQSTTREVVVLATTKNGVQLTSREFEVLTLLVAGKTTMEVADMLSLSPITVRRHISASLAKLGTADRDGAIHALDSVRSQGR
jgi:DNA-binding NarL/FixJ family response regulator